MNAELLDCAVAAARAAGEYALANLARRREVVKTLDNDVKLALDIECQARAEEVIRARFPEHDVLGEESTEHATRAGRLGWIIDPIDGTVNFSHSLPIWCCSIAVRSDDQVLAGAILAPELGELYTATADGPAQVNGSEIRVSDTDSLDASIVYTGTNTGIGGGLSRFAMFERIAEAVQRPRIVGSAALDICRVARGQGDGYFEGGIFIWDVAAAGLLVDRAGGKTEVLARRGDHGLLYLATNGHIHEDLRNVVLGGPAGER